MTEREWVLVDIPPLPLNSKILSSNSKLSEESGKKLVSFISPNPLIQVCSISDINLPLPFEISRKVPREPESCFTI